jgi:hypothetical protein
VNRREARLEEPNHACEPDLFTIDDIRKRAKVCKTIIYEHLRDGRLKAVKIVAPPE